jgi:hypothetical protein
MTFKINIKNEGPDGTIVVTETINPHESEVIFDDHMDQGELKENVECKGTGRKKFSWEHKGSDHVGWAEKADGETLIVDPPG